MFVEKPSTQLAAFSYSKHWKNGQTIYRDSVTFLAIDLMSFHEVALTSSLYSSALSFFSRQQLVTILSHLM